MCNDTGARQKFVATQTKKADSLNIKALKLAVTGASKSDLNQAIEYIMQGLHVYSRFRDSAGLRQTFDHLALVYHLQKKYVQAKWFYIQSNTLSRQLKDTSNIIKSLIELSSVKTDIKDFAMAHIDLNEAGNLAKNRKDVNTLIAVQQAWNEYYTKKGDPKNAELAINRIVFLKDSVSKQNEVAKLALLKQKDAEQIALKRQQDQLKANEDRLKILLKQKTAITTITISIIAVITLLLILFYLKKRNKN